MEIKYGIIGYASNNIGDEIQTLAQMRFLPKVDYVCVRERIKSFKPGKATEQVKLIMNAWYMQNPRFFPPPNNIIPLPISMHLDSTIIENGFLEDVKIREWMMKYGPIGTRDLFTLKKLQQAGIPSYFSGCLTLTLLPNEKFRARKVKKYVLAMNLSDKELVALKSRTVLPVYGLGKKMVGLSFQNRLRLAKCMLSIYHNADVIVTKNLHTALPALSFGVPTLLIPSSADGCFDNRFSGLYHLCNNMTSEEFIHNSKPYDIDNPPPNPEMFREIARELISVCHSFTGFDSLKSPIDDDFDPIFELIDLLQFSEKQIQRNLYYANTEQLFRALTDKKYLLNNKYRMIDDNQITLIEK
ncbi:MAG: polysaccharide pyruvyl transferase family protein [Clostridiales bacterium]|jgi:hypothetical protein|nr:polysaccharide pyruvyl transferase family protein [Clostridiales bacterium]